MFAERNFIHETVFETSQRVRGGYANRDQELENLTTLWAETTGNVDSYYFSILDGKLVSPNNNEPVLNFLRTDSEIDKAEYKFVERLETWAISGHTQNAVWASFAHRERSSDSKFIISSRDNDKIINRALVIKSLDQGTFMKTVNDLIVGSLNIHGVVFNPEILRSELIILDDNVDWISILEEHLGKEKLFNDIRTGEDVLQREKHIKRSEAYYSMMEQGFSVDEITYRMQQEHHVGNQGFSCPPSMRSGSQFITSNSLVSMIGRKERNWSYDKTGTCQVCKETTKVGPCDVCEICNDKIDANETLAA